MTKATTAIQVTRFMKTTNPEKNTTEIFHAPWALDPEDHGELFIRDSRDFLVASVASHVASLVIAAPELLQALGRFYAAAKNQHYYHKSTDTPCTSLCDCL